MIKSLVSAALGLSLALAPTSGAVAYVTQDDVITTVAGSGVAGFSGDGGSADRARLAQPRDTAVGPDGSIFVADTNNHRIRRIAPDGTISTFAGNGSTEYNGDGIRATRASLYWPHDVAVDDDGVVYIADSAHHRIRRVALDGIISTVAGTGVRGSTGDNGPATSARIKNPKSVVLYDGALYFSSLEHKVRRVDLRSGVITTVAGTGVQGYSGDGGQATRARLNTPQRLQMDSLGNLYIADSRNHRVRRVDALTGVITTVAGNGTQGNSGDGGQATRAAFDSPRGIALEGDTTLYVADSNNHRVRRVDLVSGVVNKVAGTWRGYAGDGGPAGNARLNQPRGLTVLPDGSLLVADTFNSALRRIS